MVEIREEGGEEKRRVKGRGKESEEEGGEGRSRWKRDEGECKRRRIDKEKRERREHVTPPSFSLSFPLPFHKRKEKKN